MQIYIRTNLSKKVMIVVSEKILVSLCSLLISDFYPQRFILWRINSNLCLAKPDSFFDFYSKLCLLFKPLSMNIQAICKDKTYSCKKSSIPGFIFQSIEELKYSFIHTLPNIWGFGVVKRGRHVPDRCWFFMHRVSQKFWHSEQILSGVSLAANVKFSRESTSTDESHKACIVCPWASCGKFVTGARMCLIRDVSCGVTKRITWDNDTKHLL